METLDFVVAPVEKVYRQSRNGSSQSVLYIIGGIALLAFSVIGFLLSVLSPRTSPLSIQLTTTLPAMLGIGAIYAGRTAARTPKEMGIGPDGIRLGYRDKTVNLGWDRIGWSRVETLPQSNRRVLHLYDADGR